jgi:cbb3-type cytochrome oxidase subunit 1
MLVMAYNVAKTIAAGKIEEAKIPALSAASAHA